MKKNASLTTLALAPILSITIAACSAGETDDAAADSEQAAAAEAPAEPAAEPIETPVSIYANDRDELFAFLQNAEYKSFPVHDEIHPSVGPHETVVVYYNDVITQSFADGNEEHPAGSMIVKEQYRGEEPELFGWSVSIKTHEEGDRGNGWYWYEVTSTTDPTALYPDNPGNGVPECAACHTLGQDLVRSAFPGQE